MDKKQEGKIKMARAVSGILEGFEDIVKKIPMLDASHLKLDQLIEDTEKFSQGQLNKGTEHTAQKDSAREILINEGIKICAALAAYATSSTDESAKPLKTKYQIKDTVIKRLRDMQLFAFSYQIYSDALPYVDKLEPFATAEEVKGLKAKADIFNGLLPKRRTQLNNSIRSTQNLAKTIDDIDKLLIDTIDVLIKPWEFKETDFYNSYKSSREI
jgi:hypothetical protein